jgi:hypothetical protein
MRRLQIRRLIERRIRAIATYETSELSERSYFDVRSYFAYFA